MRQRFAETAALEHAGDAQGADDPWTVVTHNLRLHSCQVLCYMPNFPVRESQLPYSIGSGVLESLLRGGWSMMSGDVSGFITMVLSQTTIPARARRAALVSVERLTERARELSLGI
jgi:hypothetical protein